MIIIPMAGSSRRFREAGYSLPKYQLSLHGRPVFDYSVISFKKYFDTERFMFIMRDTDDASDFVDERLETLGVRHADLVILSDETKGQADTVRLGLRASGVSADEPLTIFNIDTFRPSYSRPRELSGAAGYVEVFRGQGESWSFVKARPG